MFLLIFIVFFVYYKYINDNVILKFLMIFYNEVVYRFYIDFFIWFLIYK